MLQCQASEKWRPAAGSMNRKEPLSLYAQLLSGIQVDRSFGEWIDILVEDKRASVPDQVAANGCASLVLNADHSHERDCWGLAIGCSTKKWL